MKRAYGSDRVVHAAEGRIILTSRLDKGWTPRREKELTRARFPGTCVQWDEELYEVLTVEVLPVGVRYTLEAWTESSAIRVFQPYDQQSEQRRLEDHRDQQRRASSRRISWGMSLLAGHLPGFVQQRLQNEFGVSAPSLTIISAVPLFAIGVASLVFFLVEMLAPQAMAIPTPLLLLGMYFFLESGIRFGVTFIQNVPMGSVLGSIAYTIWRLSHPGAKPLPEERGNAARVAWEIAPEQAQTDAFVLREPMLALLPPEQQLYLRQRYGFAYVVWGRRTAILILTASVLGLIAMGMKYADGSATPLSVLSAVITLGVAIEQVIRLTMIREGRPVGSIFGWLVRPLTRKLFVEE